MVKLGRNQRIISLNAIGPVHHNNQALLASFHTERNQRCAHQRAKKMNPLLSPCNRSPPIQLNAIMLFFARFFLDPATISPMARFVYSVVFSWSTKCNSSEHPLLPGSCTNIMNGCFGTSLALHVLCETSFSVNWQASCFKSVFP